jgi:hypothetical protein
MLCISKPHHGPVAKALGQLAQRLFEGAPARRVNGWARRSLGGGGFSPAWRGRGGRRFLGSSLNGACFQVFGFRFNRGRFFLLA